MRYQDVVRQYLAAREASSREWKISETLIMCVELETSADIFGTFAFAAASSSRRRGPQFIRVTLFRISHDREPWVVTQTTDDPTLTSEESQVVRGYRGAIRDWISGLDECLIQSTSKVITERLARRT